MSDSPSQGSIAKNSVALTLRMILRMVVSLYTTRIVLNALGVDDFGVYNVVAGFTLMFSFVNTSMSASISRFIAFDLGCRNSINKQIETFRVALSIQIILAVCIIVIAEIAGLILINHYLDIPEGQLRAANILYQCTLLSMTFNIIQVPFNATIMAYERMTAYAYLELIYVFLLLGIAFLLQLIHGELLINYGLMLAAVNAIMLFSYIVYTKRFGICKLKPLFNKKAAKPLLTFSGSDFFSNCCLSLQSQGQNIIINRFFGLVANASIGIANQVYSALLMFTYSMTTAVRPRIIKYYAAHDYDRYFSLVSNGSRLVTFINMIICVPLIIILPKILSLWLVEVPEYVGVFCRILIINHCIFSYKTVILAALHATGNITRFSVYLGTIYALSIPLQLFLAYLGAPIVIVYGLLLLLSSINVFLIIYSLSVSAGFKAANIFKEIILPPVLTAIILICPELSIMHYLNDSIWVYTFAVGISFTITVVLSYFTILNRESRRVLNSYISRILHLLSKRL